MATKDFNLVAGPLVSVLTPVYNNADTIERAIKSVLDQTYPNIEYVIIDGGSTDGTVEIIKKYSDRLAYWVSEKDKGIANGMNKGIEKLTGKYTLILNGDDYLFANDVFEKVFSGPHSADMLYGGCVADFGIRPVKCNAHSEKFVIDKAYQGMQLVHSTLFARTEYLKKFKFDEKYRVSADGDFVSHCVAEHCTFERLDEVIFRVGVPGASASHWLFARFENWKIARKYFPGFKTDFFHLKGIVKDVAFRFFKYVFSLVGFYQLLRKIYRKNWQKKMPLLPKDCEPYEN